MVSGRAIGEATSPEVSDDLTSTMPGHAKEQLQVERQCAVQSGHRRSEFAEGFAEGFAGESTVLSRQVAPQAYAFCCIPRFATMRMLSKSLGRQGFFSWFFSRIYSAVMQSYATDSVERRRRQNRVAQRRFRSK